MLTNFRAPTPDGCLSDLTLDEWHAGELPAPQVLAAIEHLNACARCRERKQALLANAPDREDDYFKVKKVIE